MSFLTSSQRNYDGLSHSDVAQLPPIHSSVSRIPMHPLSSFDNLPPVTQLPPLASAPPTPSNAVPPSPVLDRPVSLPKLGQTRCYWCLLTPDLQFIYLDPVLAHHLGEQADLLVGKSLLAYVHPDEQASAKLDLGSVLESRTLHGSVTRVRYSRLSRVRRQLGYQGPTHEFADADKVSVDTNYMAVDLVINWASDGLVLCFMHAVVDLSPRDNDEHNKTPWTNWCGTPYMNTEQVQILYQRLLAVVPQPLSMSRVFQILLNLPERSLYMSWPPEHQEPGGPTSKDFARLAQDVQISNAVSSGTDAKTSCTRRYKAHQTMHFGGDNSKEVESIFIPHGMSTNSSSTRTTADRTGSGSIIFACHKVHPSTRDLNPNDAASQSQHYANHPYQDPAHPSYNLPHLPAQYPSNMSSTHYPPSHYASNNWSHPPESSSSQTHYQWDPQGNSLSSAPSVSSMRSSSYHQPPPPQQHQWPSQPPYLDAHPGAPPYSPQGAPSGSSYSAPPSHDEAPPSPGSDTVPPSRVTHRRGSNNSREQYGNGGRSTGNPPMGVPRCSSCKVTQSPEWRKGPSGKKDLCNACGLRYARSRAKKEGGPSQQSRRRKDRVFNSMQKDHSPSGSPGPYYDDASFGSASSNGSPGAPDLYAPTAHAGPSFKGPMSPSPSPSPGGGMQHHPHQPYMPYPHPHQGAPHPLLHAPQNAHADAPGRYSNSFYSVPPPAPPHPHPHQQPSLHHMSSHSSLHSNGSYSQPLAGPGQPPRLDPIVPVPYSAGGRMSPSPIGGSPLSTSFSSASYERERPMKMQDDREGLPPSPVSADPRNRRSPYK
ncbi:uncharacterized protein B0H18DRAFT_1094113 [Fomitopsis serialis]|uniref:uncharacterized protein n=1 Tax=Fomitopsis serialis TaxID=139415 RepID=UPI0020082464|nr:uncharacterized protein B0H18DRAFT_1094113 [Neoantrodia serialis]KAH9928603.1 hypothetical protein B0H18DRAFT_1094113 [Neoantrodia serialis]